MPPPAQSEAQARAEGGGAGFCATGAEAGGAGAGAGTTAVGLGETGGVTFAVQKRAAIATRTTPPSKAHNQRDMASPSRSPELSP